MISLIVLMGKSNRGDLSKKFHVVKNLQDYSILNEKLNQENDLVYIVDNIVKEEYPDFIRFAHYVKETKRSDVIFVLDNVTEKEYFDLKQFASRNSFGFFPFELVTDPTKDESSVSVFEFFDSTRYTFEEILNEIFKGYMLD